MSNQKCSMIKLPPVNICLMIVYKGRLACVKRNVKDDINYIVDFGECGEIRVVVQTLSCTYFSL